MSRRAHVRVAVACLFLWGTLDRLVTGQSTPTGRGQATRSVDAAPREPPTSVAVIPFTNISRSPADAWLSRGIAETVTADLREQPGLSVIGPEQLWDGGWVDLGAVLAVDLGRQLGARWLVRGGYQRVGERIRITARLVDARDGTLIQAVKVDGPVSDIFALQDRLVPELASGLALTAGTPARVVPEPRAPSRIASGESGPAEVRRRQALPAPVPPVPNDIGASGIEGTRGRPRAIDRAVPARPGATAAAATAHPAGTPVDPGAPAMTATGVAGVTIDGPPPPVPPATVARDGQGQVTIRATRLPAPLRVDGQLDEGPYSTVEPIGDFIQVEPTAGALATEPTDVWIFFDDDTIYISGRCWDSAPEARWLLKEMRRDSENIYSDENFTLVLDTFYDRRSGYFFQVNPIGGFYDAQITDGPPGNPDWNPVWDVRTGRFEGGWTFEMAIPFRSLRYQPGRAQVWGVNLRRLVQWKNEHAFVVPMPLSFGSLGIYQISLGGTLVGLEVPPGGKNLEIKPYGISGVTTDRRATPPISDTLDGDLGLDVKYGVTQNLTADFTYNTDFAQVEVDAQQVNLTRFSLFFPEKREFFLEGRGIFEFGGARQRPSVFQTDTDTPFLFFSRRIGLNQGRTVPILGGARLTGKVGRYTIGLLDIQTDDAVDAGALATNFGVVRLKRDIFRRSAVGVLFTGRSKSTLVDGSNRTYGIDATFGFHDNLRIETYVAKTETPGLAAQDLSYLGQVDYTGDRYGLQLERLVIEENFNPEVGFVRRPDMRKSFASARFSPRPRSIAAIRKLSWQGSVNSIKNNAGVLETREAQAQFGIEFENADQFGIGFSDTFEFLERPFLIAPGVTLPVGGYDFQNVAVSYNIGRTHRLVGNVSVQHGTFFSGEKTTVGLSRGRLKVTPQISIEPSLSLNWVDLPEGSFRTELIQSRIVYTPTPRMFFTGFLQYNTSNDTIGANLRLRWEYQPGSELFVVYTEERDTLTRTFPDIINRALTVKVTRLFRF